MGLKFWTCSLPWSISVNHFKQNSFGSVLRLQIWSWIHKIFFLSAYFNNSMTGNFKKKMMISTSLPSPLPLSPLSVCLSVSVSLSACQFLLKEYLSIIVLCQVCSQGWTQESYRLNKRPFSALNTKIWKNKKLFPLGWVTSEKVWLGPISSHLSCHKKKTLWQKKKKNWWDKRKFGIERRRGSDLVTFLSS